ncbi:hypothetical protein DT075_27405 [Bacillus licheniformis]|nr:hypothetical protein DT075_27405 [Bacillus licheniformis]
MNGIKKMAEIIGIDVKDLLANSPLVVHGTTVATNALLEYNGAKVGLLTTEGFRDVTFIFTKLNLRYEIGEATEESSGF